MTDDDIRSRVALMRELGILQCDGLLLGPEPRPPTRIEALQKKVDLEDNASTRRDLRVEEARFEMRAKLNAWDISDSVIDRHLPAWIFEVLD